MSAHAGLEVVTTDGVFMILEPAVGFTMHADTLEVLQFISRAVVVGTVVQQVEVASRQGSSMPYTTSTPDLIMLTLAKVLERRCGRGAADSG